MEYNSIARTLLAHLAEVGPLMIDAFLPPHPKSRLARALLGLDQKRYFSRTAARHSFSSILNRLKREGLVTRAGPKKKSSWIITAKGRISLSKKSPPQRNSPQAIIYTALPPQDNITRLVTFDVPEKQRAKRNWLRKELIACGYDALQKSVFIGRRPLPDELIRMIEILRLDRCVHLVGIDRKGTLTQSA